MFYYYTRVKVPSVFMLESLDNGIECYLEFIYFFSITFLRADGRRLEKAVISFIFDAKSSLSQGISFNFNLDISNEEGVLSLWLFLLTAIFKKFSLNLANSL